MDFLSYQLKQTHKQDQLMQVTTHGNLLSPQDVSQIGKFLMKENLASSEVSTFLLQEFDTELDFCSQIGAVFKTKRNGTHLLILQCDSGHTGGELIACAKYRIVDEWIKKRDKQTLEITHVLVIIHLPMQAKLSSFVGFQGGSWTSVHIDELVPDNDLYEVSPEVVTAESISELFCVSPKQELVVHEPVDVTQHATQDGHVSADAQQGKGYARHQQRYWRLHSCIQAAVSHLQDGKDARRGLERISILEELIPDGILELQCGSFYELLVQHMHNLLKQREDVHVYDKNWVLNEAMNAKNLQSGGTFRNALSRRIDNIILPIFTAIIRFTDYNYNLDLILQDSLSQLWLDMFGNTHIMQFNYDTMISKEWGPRTGSRELAMEFRCRLPFSWVIKDAVDSQWENATHQTGNRCATQKKLSLLISDLPGIGEMMHKMNDINPKDLYKRYLYDFVRMVHTSNQSDCEAVESEFELIAAALNDLVNSLDKEEETLQSNIAALHVIYYHNQENIMWFGQLASKMPLILKPLQHQPFTDDNEMLLHIHAVSEVLVRLQPPLLDDRCKGSTVVLFKTWINQLRVFQITINAVLSLSLEHSLVKQTRLQWQIMCAIRMFAEHIILKHDVPSSFAKDLYKVLQTHQDFLKADTVGQVMITLDSFVQKHRGKDQIKNGCQSFFVEMVSSLCFGQKSPPEPQLIQILMRLVFAYEETSGVTLRDMRPFKEEESGSTVTFIRSFLLQLLLEHNSKEVYQNLTRYFSQSSTGHKDLNTYLLCAQCLEDQLFRSFSSTSTSRSKFVFKYLTDGHKALIAAYKSNNVHIDGVASVRFSLGVVAELMQKEAMERSEAFAMPENVLKATKALCTESGINKCSASGVTGPCVYLMKLIFRLYGHSCLIKVAAKYPWVIPDTLQHCKEQKSMDPFVVYGPQYSKVQAQMDIAAYSEDTGGLKEALKAQAAEGHNATELAVLALFSTLFNYRTGPTTGASKKIPVAVLDAFLRDSTTMSTELYEICRALLANEQGGPLSQMRMHPKQTEVCRDLTAIVIHTITVLHCMIQATALQPLIQLLQNPGKQKDKYLPTMPEDFLPDAKAVLGNTFYECPNGHPYYISECGRPWVESTCPTCHLPIGGRGHELTSTNRKARTVDATQTGHCLGDPHHRSSTPISERQLSPAAVCIVRALMHSVLVWTSCRTQRTTEGLLQLVTSGSVQPRGLSEFFWRHLEKDLELLCRALSKNMQKAVLVLHLVIKRMGSFTTHFQKTSLTSRQDRVAWECNFNTTYIQPIMENVDRELDIAMKMILKDAKAVNNQLLYVVYERMESASGLLDPHLWTFRTRITLDHLSLTLQQKGIQECPILLRFLKEEPDLRATQYIPDVVKLQQKLYDQFDRTLDKTEAVKTTFKMFLRGLSSVTTRERYQRLFRSVQKAWALVKNKLQYHTRFRVSQEFILPALTEDVPLEYLIPTTTGAGACTTALVDFLMYTHNNFIEWCMSTDASSKSFWQEHKVPLTRVHGCHLLDYKGQIIPIVLAHCKYSLRLGEGQSVTYDLPALEKHFLNRFIYGKPLILSDIPQVQYKKDVYSSGNFAVIRKKVSPQTSLPFQIQLEILSDLRSLSRLKETLDVVDIVLGFLSSGGGKAEKNLGDYIDHTLRMSKRRFSTKAKQLCTLGNILSLWKTLAVALAKQLMLSEQEPFDHISDGNGPPEGLDLQQKQALDHSLPSFDLDQLLGIFYEFIQTYGRYASPEQKSWPLKDTLIAYLEESDMPLPAALEDHFPDDITVAQAEDTWKHIVHYQQQTAQ